MKIPLMKKNLWDDPNVTFNEITDWLIKAFIESYGNGVLEDADPQITIETFRNMPPKQFQEFFVDIMGDMVSNNVTDLFRHYKKEYLEWYIKKILAKRMSEEEVISELI